MNETAQFLGGRDRWRGAALSWDEVHGLWGGWYVRVGGDGRVVVKGVPPSAPQVQLQKRLAPESLAALFQVCIESNVVAMQFPPRDMYLPDEGHTTLTLTNGNGEARKVVRWAHDPMDEGFEFLCNSMRALT